MGYCCGEFGGGWVTRNKNAFLYFKKIAELGADLSVRGARKYYFYIYNIFIICNWVVTRWQWLFYMYTKYEIGY